MTKEQALALVAKHGSQKAAALAAGVTRHVIYHAINRSTGKGVGRPRINPLKEQGKDALAVRSFQEFRNTFDLETIVPKRVNDTLKKLGSGWLFEMEFCKLANVTSTQIANFRERYADHIVCIKDRRRIWVGKKNIAEEMRRML